MSFRRIEIITYLLIGQAFALLIAAGSCPLTYVLALTALGGLIDIAGLLLLEWQIRIFNRDLHPPLLK